MTQRVRNPLKIRRHSVNSSVPAKPSGEGAFPVVAYDISEGSIDDPSKVASGVITSDHLDGLDTPDQPAGLTATPNFINGQSVMDLSWDAVTGAVEYEVRYKRLAESVYTYVRTTATSMRLSPLVGNTAYDFSVQAVNGVGNSSGFPADITQATARDGTPPAVPANLTASAGIRKVIASWDIVADLDIAYYEADIALDDIFTSVVYTWKGNASLFAYEGDPDTTYYVRVRAVDTSGNLSAYSVFASGVTTGKVDTADIVAAAVTNAKVATDAIDTAQIRDGAVDTAKIIDAAIVSAKIADAAIVTAKIADASIVNAKIGLLAVGEANIADAAISNAKIADLAVDAAKIADATIVAAKIANATIVDALIANATITSAKIANLAVDKLTAGTLSVGVTLSGVIRTATDGPRVEMDSNGLRLYDSGGQAVVNLDTTTGSATFKGRVSSGSRVVGSEFYYPTDATDTSRVAFWSGASQGNPAGVVSWLPANSSQEVIQFFGSGGALAGDGWTLSASITDVGSSRSLQLDMVSREASVGDQPSYNFFCHPSGGVQTVTARIWFDTAAAVGAQAKLDFVENITGARIARQLLQGQNLTVTFNGSAVVSVTLSVTWVEAFASSPRPVCSGRGSAAQTIKTLFYATSSSTTGATVAGRDVDAATPANGVQAALYVVAENGQG